MRFLSNRKKTVAFITVVILFITIFLSPAVKEVFAALTQRDSCYFEPPTADSAYEPNMLKVNGSVDIYAIAYSARSDRPGYIKTFRIQPNGVFIKTGGNCTIIDTYQIAPDVQFPRMLHIEGTAYAVLYNEPGGRGLLQTVTINTNGTIPHADNAYIDREDIDPSVTNPTHLDFVRVQGATNSFLVVYPGGAGTGYARTFSIHADGTNIQPQTTAYLFENTSGVNVPRVINVAGTQLYLIGWGNALYLKTIRVSSGGTLISDGGSRVLGEAQGSFLDFVQLGTATSNVYAVAYKGASNMGKIKTFSINLSTGNINILTTTLGESVRATTPDITPIGNDQYAVVYETTNAGCIPLFAAGGCLKVFTIPSNGLTVTAVPSSITLFGTGNGSTPMSPVIIPVGGTYYAIAYSDAGTDGMIRTFDFAGLGGPLPGPSASECSDGFDNDSDSLVDFGSDPGCTSAGDDYEKDETLAGGGGGVDCGIRFYDGAGIRKAACQGNAGVGLIDTTHMYDSTDGITPDAVWVGGDYYAVAYQGTGGGDGFVKTIQVNAAGTVVNDNVSSRVFDASTGVHPSIQRVPGAGNMYLIAYEGQSNRGMARTISISPSTGLISAPNQGGSYYHDSLMFENSNVESTHLTYVGTNGSTSIFAIAYTGSGNDGMVKTVSVDGLTGMINDAVLSTLTFDTRTGEFPFIIHVENSYYFAVAYEGDPNTYGYVRTFYIDPVTGAISGNLNADGTYIDTWRIDTVVRTPALAHIEGSIYAVAFGGSSVDNGWIQTFTINPDGTIPQADGAYISRLNYRAQKGTEPDIIHLLGDTYVIATIGGSSNGWITILTITPSGTITMDPGDDAQYFSSNIGAPVLQKTASGKVIWLFDRMSGGQGGIIRTFSYTDAAGTSSVLRVYNSGQIYPILLVAPGSPTASRLRVRTSTGTMSVQLYP